MQQPPPHQHAPSLPPSSQPNPAVTQQQQHPSTNPSNQPIQPPQQPLNNNNNTTNPTANPSRPQPSKEQLVAIFKEKLIATGEKARLKQTLHSRLTEVKWKQPLIQHCQQIVQREGLEKVTLDGLVAQTVKLGRETVPVQVRQEMMEQIRKSLSQVQRQG